MLPFDRYPGGGRVLLGRGSTGDGSSRKGYGLTVMDDCGTKCVYCDRELAEPYEAWLTLSVDHVIPVSAELDVRDPGWLDDLANKVTCCRACNEFLNRFRVVGGPISDLESFFALRDSVFAQKRAKARRRHEQERLWHEQWRASKAAA